MYFLIYTSYATVEFKEEDLKALLNQSREKNKELSITGLLLYFDEKFLQLIEGEEQDIKLLYSAICNDSRHKDVISLFEGNVEKRFFEDWSMCFKSVSKKELAGEEAYKNLIGNSLNTSSALKLFKILAQQK